MGWGLGSSVGSTFTPGLGRIRLSPRRGSVSRASITPQPLGPSWAAGQRREEPPPPPRAESRPGCSRDSSCPAAVGHGGDTGPVPRGQGSTLEHLPQLSALRVRRVVPRRGTELERGSRPTRRVKPSPHGTKGSWWGWLWALSLPPPWLWEGRGRVQGLRAQQGGAGGGSGKHRGPLSAHISLSLQDYVDALITNYCVSAGRALSLSHLLHGAVMGSEDTLSARVGGGVGRGPWQGPHCSSPSLPRSGHPCKLRTSTLCLCSTGSVTALASPVPVPWASGCRLCPLCPQAGCCAVCRHRLELLPVLESESDVSQEPCPLPVPARALPDPSEPWGWAHRDRDRWGHAGSWQRPSPLS